MPIFYQRHINDNTKLAVWHIQENEDFFLEYVPLQSFVTHPHKRLQHLAGRYLLYFLFNDFPLEQIAIADTRKPYLQNEQYHFSISHCGDYAAAIVSKTERVGIDIEIPTEKVLRVRKKFLHKEELKGFNLNEVSGEGYSDDELQLATVLWSAKEAMFKWWGSGEIDFSEMLRIAPFELKNKGSCDALFKKDAVVKPLQLHYKLWENLSLVYTNNEFTLAE